MALAESRFCLIDISEYANEKLGFLTTACFFSEKFASKDVCIDHVFVRWQENVKKKNHKLKYLRSPFNRIF